MPGVDGPVTASRMWDPDGAGPATPVLVVAGSFQIAVDQVVSNVAAWDPVSNTWSAMGSNNGPVHALETLPNGDLVGAGAFGNPAGGAFVARWNGSAWVAVGPGVAFADQLAVLTNGDLVAAGTFAAAGGVPAQNIARWNGTSWLPLGSGLPMAPYAIVAGDNGDLVVCGDVASMGGLPSTAIARWNNGAWFTMGVSIGGVVRTLAKMPNGDIVAGGDFLDFGSGPGVRIARWNGATWTPVPSPAGFGVVNKLAVRANGNLFASSGFVAEWNGSTWTPIPGQWFSLGCITELPGGDLFVGGSVAVIDGVAVWNIARRNGSTWLPIGYGLDSAPARLRALPNGDLVALGGFQATQLAKRTGTTWAPFGAGIAGSLEAMEPLSNGNVVVVGSFTSAGGVPVNNVARWNGANWSSLGTPFWDVASSLTSLLALPNGDLLVGGRFFSLGTQVCSVARWSGGTWSPLGGVLGTANRPIAFAALPSGEIVAGVTDTVTGNILRWNGAAWTPLGGGVTYSGAGIPVGFPLALPLFGVSAITRLANGDLLARGTFDRAGVALCDNWARWNGSAWSAVTPAPQSWSEPVVPLPDGEFVAYTTDPTQPLVRHRATGWETIQAALNSQITTIEAMPDGRLAIGGYFTTAELQVSPFFVTLAATCPATLSDLGGGCVGSGGANTLTSTTLPWIDSTFTARGTGLPTTALVVTVTSPTSLPAGAAPLLALFPQAGPGCDLRVAPDILTLLVTTNGTAQSSFFLPNTPPLVGVTFFHQMIPIEFDALGAWVSVTATNALQLTAGIF